MVRTWMRRLRGIEVGWSAYVLVGVMGVFAVLRLLYSLPRFSDGNVYLYVAQALHDGARLYLDVFYSSPPLLPYVYQLWGALFGYSWQAFNWIPLLASLLDAGLLYAIVRRRAAPWAAVVSSAAYLFSFTVLATTDFVSDVHVVTTLVLIAWFLLERQRFAWAGGLLGLAFLAKIYAVVPAAGFVLVELLARRPQAAWRMFAAGAAVAGAGLGYFAVRRGALLYDMLITSHLGEIAGLSRLAIWRFFVLHDPLLAAGGAAGLLLYLWPLRSFWLPASWRRGNGQPDTVPGAAWWLVPLCLLVFLVLYQDVYFLYFKLLAVWCAAWVGWGVWRLAAISRRAAAGAVLIALVLTGVSAVRYVREQAQAAVIDQLDEITAYVERNTVPGEAIFGSFEIAPLVTLEADRSLWHHQADTNAKWFQTGYFDAAEWGRGLANDEVGLILVKTTLLPDGRMAGGFEQLAPAAFFAERCRVGRVFPIANDYSSNAVVAWRCDQ